MEFPAIIVERPHRRPAGAYIVRSEREVIDLACESELQYVADHLPELAEDDTRSFGEQVDIDLALEALGHDLNRLTLLESAGEATRYIEEPDYCGRHNKGINQVAKLARELDWRAPTTDDEEAEDEEEEDN